MAAAAGHNSARAMGGPTYASAASVQPVGKASQATRLGVPVAEGVTEGVRVADAVAVAVAVAEGGAEASG